MRPCGLLLPLLLAAPPPAVAPCACVPGPVPPSTLQAVEGGNSAFAEDGPLLRALDLVSDDCGRRLWREAFILAAAWEANHEALGRYTRARADLPTYFVVPTACAADACIDHRCDWAKNAMLDAEMLLAVAKASVLAGRRDPRQWFLPEEVLGNWAEIAVDRSNNDKSAALPLLPPPQPPAALCPAVSAGAGCVLTTGSGRTAPPATTRSPPGAPPATT